MRARGLEPPRASTQRVLNPQRLPVPPRPRGRLKDRGAGYHPPMSDPEQRERESRETDETKFAEVSEEIERAQREAAEKIGEPLERREDDSDDS
jgi:hypothetical protein